MTLANASNPGRREVHVESDSISISRPETWPNSQTKYRATMLTSKMSLSLVTDKLNHSPSLTVFAIDTLTTPDPSTSPCPLATWSNHDRPSFQLKTSHALYLTQASAVLSTSTSAAIPFTKSHTSHAPPTPCSPSNSSHSYNSRDRFTHFA